MHDDLAATNRARWNALVDANVAYTRPMLDLTPQSARSLLDPLGVMGAETGNMQGKEVLCLASGGGQQSVAFALLGAKVTVFDLSDQQLTRDQAAARHYGLNIRTVQGDMRDLSAFGEASFDLVYHAYSINFVPHVQPVLAEVARVIRPHALYRIEWANPFTQLIDPDEAWDGTGYSLRHAYLDGREITELYPTWTIYGDAEDDSESKRIVESPREFVHALSTMINSLIAHGFIILRSAEFLGEATYAQPESPPGSWAHFLRVAAPYLTLWARYRPDVFA